MINPEKKKLIKKKTWGKIYKSNRFPKKSEKVRVYTSDSLIQLI